jgi:hypothetical protein
MFWSELIRYVALAGQIALAAGIAAIITMVLKYRSDDDGAGPTTGARSPAGRISCDELAPRPRGFFSRARAVSKSEGTRIGFSRPRSPFVPHR